MGANPGQSSGSCQAVGPAAPAVQAPMDSGSQQPGKGGAAIASVAKGGYASAADALKSVGSSFNTWTTSLTATSIQMCYAVVGADWIVFSPIQNLRANWSAKWSLGCVLAAITVNLITAYVMSEWHRMRYGYAEKDWDRWEREYIENAGRKSPWPASGGMAIFAGVTRFLKLALPLAGGVLLAIGAFAKK